MGLPSGMGLRRGRGLPLRLTKSEKTELKRLADAAGVSMVEYVRCKTFDIDTHLLSGKPKRRRTAPPLATQKSAPLVP